jgi:hypothetical protein
MAFVCNPLSKTGFRLSIADAEMWVNITFVIVLMEEVV